MKKQQDLIIIGGGVMGLMTAYFAANFVKNITILEKRTIGKENQEAASFGFTRSIRVDFLEPLYATLAYEAQLLWLDLENKSGTELFSKCGCLNIAKKSITPNLENTYAERSYEVSKKLNYKQLSFDRSDLLKKFPQFDIDMARLDTNGGLLLVEEINTFILKELKKKKVTIIENVNVLSIAEEKNGVSVKTDTQTFSANKIVLTPGKGTNDLLQLIENNKQTFPITYSRPQRKYYYPPKKIFNSFLPKNFPVFAYTDVGIYGHPIFDVKKGAIKIAYFVPVGIKKDDDKIKSVEDFVKECMPILKDVPSAEITDADNCWYDTVVDDDFIIGKLPTFNNIIVGTGWRGTGYKYAPLIGKILSQLAIQGETVYDIKQFATDRFVK
jgi:glycine/D-amino acid oxidase-like deaminating enzyme